MIFNVVVDAVIRHWVLAVMPTEESTGLLGLTIIELASYFYDEDGLMSSTQLEWLQRAFEILTCLFNCICLRTNTTKTIVMVCQTCHAPGGMLD